jgi:hypothetical protein
MSLRHFLCACIAACWAAVALVSPCGAQVAPPPTTLPAGESGGKVLPEFKADGPRDGVVGSLQQDDPNLRVVLVRDPRAVDMPRVQLLLKNVTAADVLNVIVNAYPDVTMNRIQGSTGGMIYVMRVRPTSSRMVNGTFSAGETGVHVYNLTVLVQAWIDANSHSFIAGSLKVTPAQSPARPARR